MKSYLSAVALFLSFNVVAQVNVNTSGLTDVQKAELIKVAEQMRKQQESPEAIVEKVDKWVDVGERFGKMMGGAAKEVGIAVNDFVKTPVGMMTAGLIVWNYMGNMIVHVTVGLMILFTTFSLLAWYSRRLRIVEITYDKEAGRNWLDRYPVLKKEVSQIDSDSFGALLFAYAVCLVVSLITIFAW